MPKIEKKLIECRNNRLRKRFNYWYVERRLRYDDVIKKLKWEEFFLSESTITMIIKEQGYYKNEKDLKTQNKH